MNFLGKPHGIVIHHSSTRDTESLSFDAIRRYHVETMNWDDIGYHYLIENVGGEYMPLTGRGLQYVGAHTVGENDCIGVCVVGDFDNGKPVPEVVQVLARLCRSLLELYPHLSVDDIHYHREYADKTCPGLDFPSLDLLQHLVRA